MFVFNVVLYIVLAKYVGGSRQKRGRGIMCIIYEEDIVPMRLNGLVSRRGERTFRFACAANNFACCIVKCKERPKDNCGVGIERFDTSQARVCVSAVLAKIAGRRRGRKGSCPCVMLGDRFCRGSIVFRWGCGGFEVILLVCGVEGRVVILVGREED